MKKAILAVMTFAALSGAQANALAFENLPEAHVGSGGTPDVTAPPSTMSMLQQAFDLVGESGGDGADEASADTDPEGNMGNGTVP